MRIAPDAPRTDEHGRGGRGDETLCPAPASYLPGLGVQTCGAAHGRLLPPVEGARPGVVGRETKAEVDLVDRAAEVQRVKKEKKRKH